MEKRTPGLERKACELCRKLKSKCDNKTPCGTCASQKSQCIRLIRKRPTRADASCVVRHPKKRLRVASVETSSSSDCALDLFFEQTRLSDVPPASAFCQDQLLPDMDSLLHDLFSALNRPRPNDWSSTSSYSLHRLLSAPTPVGLSRIDPLESHRLTIIDHLWHSSEFPREEIGWFTLTNIRHGLIAFFRHCHRHLPIIHLPTWDIATIPSSLVLVQALVGSVYLSNASANALRARRIISDAFSLIFRLDEVYDSGRSLIQGFQNEEQPTPSIESMQAISLLVSLAGWYVTLGESRQVRKQYNKIVNIVRKSGLLRPLDNNPKPDWEQWVYEEKRRR